MSGAGGEPSIPLAALVVVGLGSNLGDRLVNLRRGADELGQLEQVELLARSSVFETAAVGGPPQPDYLNAAVSLRTRIDAGELLERALGIERALGRRRPDPVRWGPRAIDIDLLWVDRATVSRPGLTIPHPRLLERPFALQPLLELVPDAVDPRSGQRLDGSPAATATIVRLGRL